MARLSLDTVVNLALLGTCVVIVTTTLSRTVSTGPADTANPTGYSKGELLPAFGDVKDRRDGNTLILLVSSTCRYCTESMPFYAELAGKRSLTSTRVLLVGTESTETLSAYAQEHKLEIDAVLSVPPGTFKVRGTPTILLADREGRLISEWRGALRGREKEVEAAVLGQ